MIKEITPPLDEFTPPLDQIHPTFGRIHPTFRPLFHRRTQTYKVLKGQAKVLKGARYAPAYPACGGAGAATPNPDVSITLAGGDS
jgi:hypothetical protein